MFYVYFFNVRYRKDDFLTLLSSPDLLVVEGEFDLYRMLKNVRFLCFYYRKASSGFI